MMKSMINGEKTVKNDEKTKKNPTTKKCAKRSEKMLKIHQKTMLTKKKLCTRLTKKKKTVHKIWTSSVSVSTSGTIEKYRDQWFGIKLHENRTKTDKC